MAYQVIGVGQQNVPFADVYKDLRAFIVPKQPFTWFDARLNDNSHIAAIMFAYYSQLNAGTDQEKALTASLLASINRSIPAFIADLPAANKKAFANWTFFDNGVNDQGHHAKIRQASQPSIDNMMAVYNGLSDASKARLPERAVAILSIACLYFIKTQSNTYNDEKYDLIERMNNYGGAGIPNAHRNVVIDNIVSLITGTICYNMFPAFRDLLAAEKIYTYRATSARGVSDISMAITAKKAAPSPLLWFTVDDSVGQFMMALNVNMSEEALASQADFVRNNYTNGKNAKGQDDPGVVALVPVPEKVRAYSYVLLLEIGIKTAKGYIRGQRASNADPSTADQTIAAYRLYAARQRIVLGAKTGGTASAKIASLLASGVPANVAVREVAAEYAAKGVAQEVANAKADVNQNANAHTASFNGFLAGMGFP